MKARTAAVLLLMAALLTDLGRTGESWGQAEIARVGVLTFRGTNVDEVKEFLTPFRRSLADQGWNEGKNVLLDYTSVVSDPAQLREAAAQLVRLKVDVIFADSAPSLRAAHAATSTIPIVAVDFTNDPVAEGYAASYGRPGGNITGIFLDAPEFAGKWFQLMKAIVPGLSHAAVLWDPSPGPTHLRAVQSVARSVGVQLQVLEVRKPDDIDKAFSALRGRPQAVIILPSPVIYAHSARLAKLTLKHRLPATSMARAFAEAGGAVVYGPDQTSVYERCGVSSWRRFLAAPDQRRFRWSGLRRFSSSST